MNTLYSVGDKVVVLEQYYDDFRIKHGVVQSLYVNEKGELRYTIRFNRTCGDQQVPEKELTNAYMLAFISGAVEKLSNRIGELVSLRNSINGATKSCQ